MHKYYRTLMGIAAAAALGVVTMTSTAQLARAQAAAAQPPAGQKQKQVKDTGEYDIYNEVLKDVSPQGGNAAKLLTDLNTWVQKYPDSDFKDVRIMYFVQAYAGTNDGGKAIDAAKPLLSRGVDGVKAALDNPGTVLQMLFISTRAGIMVAAGGTATPDQLETATMAAKMLTDFGKQYFVDANKPANMAAKDWADGLKQCLDTANTALLQVSIAPATGFMKANPKDPATCAKAEAVYKKALDQYPDSGQISYLLAAALRCQQTVAPEKVSQAIYEYARTVVATGEPPFGFDAKGKADIEKYLTTAYTSLHGSDEGLADLKTLAAKSPLPPADFKLKTKAEIANEKEEQFRGKYPQLAMWLSIKGKLADTEGEQYFQTSLKDADLKGQGGTKLLRGVLVEAKPACRPTVLVVAVPLPDATGTPTPEITLQLLDDEGKEAPLTGKPEVGGAIQWDGVPLEFTKEPFMLTMATTKAKLEGLSMTPCAAPPAKKGTAAAPAAKKKAD